MGNKAAHDLKEIELKDVLEAHKLLFEISVWYMEVYVSHKFIAPKYQLPLKFDQQTNPWGKNDLEALLKPYFDQTLQKVDEMREEFERQLKEIKMDKEKNSSINVENGSAQQLELEAQADYSSENKKHVTLKYKGQTILLTTNLAETPILNIPIIGCNYLLRELSRVGIDSLAKILVKEQDISKEVKDNTIKGPEERLPLSKEKENIVSIFINNNFNKNYENTKAIELEHLSCKEVVYLINHKKTSLVLHPKTVEMNDYLKSTGKKLSSTALKQFPKEINKGKTPINYGYLYKFETDNEIEPFLKNLINIHLAEINN